MHEVYKYHLHVPSIPSEISEVIVVAVTDQGVVFYLEGQQLVRHFTGRPEQVIGAAVVQAHQPVVT